MAPTRTRIHHGLDLASILHAIDDGQVVPYFQPVVELHTGETLGWEALARWDHPERGILPAAAFVPELERAGMVGLLDVAMSHAAFARYRALSTASGPCPWLAVNVDASVLGNGATLDRLHRCVTSGEIAAGDLVVEVTESAAIPDLRAAGEELACLRSLGVRVALDDFGAGHTRFSYLLHLPTDLLKLDASFARHLVEPGGTSATIRALLAIAHRQDTEVIAEGIESVEQLSRLRNLGCRAGQGYYLGAPAPDAVVAGPRPSGVLAVG